MKDTFKDFLTQEIPRVWELSEPGNVGEDPMSNEKYVLVIRVNKYMFLINYSLAGGKQEGEDAESCPWRGSHFSPLDASHQRIK